MDTASFRRHAHALVDWMADYMDGVERYPVKAQVKPGEIAARLPLAPPETGEPMARIFEDFERDLMPGVTHWQHPSFFAYFPANTSPPSVLAEMLTATLGLQCMMWQTSPAAAELEGRVLDWLRQLLGMPEGFTGVIQDSASGATLCAILTARERATDWRVNETGVAGAAPLTVYCSAETHSSIEKAVKIAGLGRTALRKIPVDEKSFAMRPDALADAVAADLAAGHKPICVVATLGTTGASGVDPLRPIGELCRRHGIFLHVDAAWAGSALVLPDYRWMLDGIEHVDSLVMNPHKWLLTNFDCSAHFVREPEALIRTLEILPEFLKTRERGQVDDYRDWSVQLGRRFRALKLWFVIRSYGGAGLRDFVRGHIALAQEAASWVERAADFELLSPATLALFCFRYRPPGIRDEAELDRWNEALLHQLNDGGRVYFTQTRVGGHYCIRFAIGQRTTERRHVEAAWAEIRETARRLQRPDAAAR
jgi:aromatic-L-amino-acid decarboxylase